MRIRASRARCPCPCRCGRPSAFVGLCSSNQGADPLAADRRDDRAWTVDVEYDQRKRVLAAERDRRLVDHLELLHDHIAEADLVVELRLRVTLGIRRVDALD